MYNTFEIVNTVSLDKNAQGENTFSKCWNRIFRTHYNSNQIILISILSFGSICFGTAYSMQAPFFPSQAKLRGIDEEWIGLVSGILDLGFTTGSIVSGKLFTKFKSRNILTTSLAFGGLNLILFGSLQWITNTVVFRIVACTLRIFIGLGMGTFFTACFTILFLEFSDNLSKVYATIEMCYAIGLIVGPVVGGILFQLGGYINFDFSLPFLILGTFQVTVASCSHILVNIEKKYEIKEKGSFRHLLKHFGIALNIVIYFNAGALLGFNTATLDLHLSKISNLSASLKGMIFFISGIAYALLNHFWGKLTEKPENCYKISIFGCISSLICFTFVGPLPFIPLDSHIVLVMISQVFLGIGVSAILVASFVQGFNEIIKYGFTESPSTTAILSSLFTTSESLGYAVSPIVGGYIVENYDYRWATLPLFIFQIILILTILWFGIIKQNKRCYQLDG